jgi:hypothetical protein
LTPWFAAEPWWSAAGGRERIRTREVETPGRSGPDMGR